MRLVKKHLAAPLAIVSLLSLASAAFFALADDFSVAPDAEVYSQTTIIDEGNTGGNLLLQFGNTSARALNWDNTNTRFNFTHPLNISGNNGSLELGDGTSADHTIVFDDDGGTDRQFGWDDSANAFSTFGTTFGYRIYSAATPPTTCRPTVSGMMFIDTDSGITYMCDGTNGRNQWLSLQEMRLAGDTDPSSNFCTAGGEVGTTNGCTPNWGDDVGAGTSSEMGLFLPYPITVTGYDFSSDYDACLTGSFDLELWTSTGSSDDNNYSLASTLASNLTGEAANAMTLAEAVDGSRYMIWGVDNNCGESISRWNMTIFYRYRHP